MALRDFWRGVLGKFGPTEGQRSAQPEGVDDSSQEGAASVQEDEPEIGGMTTKQMLEKGFRPKKITMHYPDNTSESSHQERNV